MLQLLCFKLSGLLFGESLQLNLIGTRAKLEVRDAFGGARAPSRADNPADAYLLTDQQAARAVMVLFEQVAAVQVRYAIGACCTTGRNFLFGGFSRLLTKLVHLNGGQIVCPPQTFMECEGDEGEIECAS